LGPALGGLLLGLGGWRLIFLINIPAGIIGIALGWFFLPRSRHLSARQPIDLWGIGTFVVAITGLLLAISFGNEAGWASWQILADLVLTAVFTTLFIRHELHDPAPMMRLAIFKVAAFSAGISSGLLSYLCLFGVLFVLPFYLEFSGHLRPGSAGLQLLVLPLALGITAPLTGTLADRVGARSLTVSGMIVVGIALLAMAAHPPGTGLLLIELAAAGIGLGMFTPPNNSAIMTAAPRQQAGMASGILNMTRGLGTSMGVALTALVFGLAAGTSAARAMAPGAATRGLAAAAVFLSISAFLAAALAGLRGNAPLDHDPATLVEG